MVYLNLIDVIDHNPFRPQSNPSWRLVQETQIEDLKLKDDYDGSLTP